MKTIAGFTLLLFAIITNVFAQNGEEIAYDLINIESLNTRFSEFGAVPFDDGVILVSKRGELANEELDLWSGGSYFDIYSGRLELGNDETYVVSKIPGSINSKFHDGPVSYDPNGKLLYFTRSNKTPFIDEKTGVQIFRLSIHSVKYENGKWTEERDFPFNEKKHSVGHPAVSSDGNRLFFVSDKSGGFGGTDIYMCEKKNGEWSEPVNVGNQINTARDEMFPFYHKSGRLYFASKGRGGMGGLDVFESSLMNGIWSSAKNMGNPINSSRDDFSLFINDDLTEGLLSSNRAGGSGGDDIYKVFVYGSSYINEPDVVVATNVEQVLEATEQQATATTTNTSNSNVENINTDWGLAEGNEKNISKEEAHVDRQKEKGVDVVMPVLEKESEKVAKKAEHEITYLEEEQEEEIRKEKLTEEINKATEEMEMVDIPRTNYQYEAPEQSEKETENADDSSVSTSISSGVKYTQQITDKVIDFDEVVSSSNSSPKPVEDEDELAFVTSNNSNQAVSNDVSFRIQLGAYSTPKPNMFIHLKNVGSLDEYNESGLFKYLVGFFDSMESAETAVEKIRANGVPDAFIVGYMNGRKISKEEAQEYLD